MNRVWTWLNANRREIGIAILFVVIIVALVLSAIRVVQRQYEPFFLQTGSWLCTKITKSNQGLFDHDQCVRYERKAGTD